MSLLVDRPLIEVRPAVPSDAGGLVLRPEDRLEAEAWSHDPPEKTVADSIAGSSEAWAGLAGGELVCLFGVAPLTLVGVTGIPWLMGSVRLEQHQRAFLRRNRDFVERWNREYPVLRNFVDVRNKTSQRWLRWLGFTLGEPVPYGVSGLPFHPFERIA